jgi:nicotinate-nucleotide adenylyltransferase
LQLEIGLRIKIMVQIALFGTSADPPTVGHQVILEKLATRFDQVAVWAADNPFKPDQTPLAHRQAMLALLIQDLHQRHPNILLCPQLSDARTLNSVHLAQQNWPQGQFTLVVGSDVLDSLPNWYRVRELLSTIHLLIVPRPNAPVTSPNLDVLAQLGGQFAVATFMGPDVSSTAYRQSKAEDGMMPAIADYIQRHNLYTRTRGRSL